MLSIASVCSLLFLNACKDNTCGNEIGFVQPNANPANHEVMIKATGFTQKAAVYFGQIQASTRPGPHDTLIAKVPVGLRSDVELSVSENNCIARTSFKVLDSLPGIYGLSLPNIVLPTVLDAGNAPSGITNEWFDSADSNHMILFLDTLDINYNTNFKHNLDASVSREMHKTIQLLGARKPNPITGTYIEVSPYTIQIFIDRTSNGGTVEEYNGQYVIPDLTVSPQAFRMLALTSKSSGRQLVLYFK